MSVSVIWTVMCSICNWWDDRTVSNVSAAQARAGARRAGWTCTSGGDLCPACAGKIKSPGAP